MTIVRSVIIECDRCHMFEDYKPMESKDGVKYYANDKFIRILRSNNVTQVIKEEYLCHACNDALDDFMLSKEVKAP